MIYGGRAAVISFSLRMDVRARAEIWKGQVRPRGWSLPPVDLWVMLPTGQQASTEARACARFIETQLSNGDA
jgi:hypothetical protein